MREKRQLPAANRFISSNAFLKLAIPLGLLLTGCAIQPTVGPVRPPPASAPQIQSPEQLTLRIVVSQHDRLYRVAAPILVNNAELCKGNARNLLGFTAKNKHSYSPDLAMAAQTEFGLGERLQVMGVLPGSGASKAGVRRGDQLVSVENAPVPEGLNAERQAAMMLAPLVATRNNVKLTVLRDGVMVPTTVSLTRACAFSIELGNTDTVNAYNDGRRAMITRGMMNFTQSDTELAYVLAREIAHNTLGHAAKLTITNTVGAVIDNLIKINPDLTGMAGTAGIRPMSQELDAEADRLALYMLARAGYDIGPARGFWDRLAMQYPTSAVSSYTALHPSTGQRLATIERTTREIRERQAARRPLLP